MDTCTKCGRGITNKNEGCKYCKPEENPANNGSGVIRDRYYDNYNYYDNYYDNKHDNYSKNALIIIVKFIIFFALVFIHGGIYIGFIVSVIMAVAAKKTFKKFGTRLLKFYVSIYVLYSMCSIYGTIYENPSIAIMILKIIQTIIIFFIGRVA